MTSQVESFSSLLAVSPPSAIKHKLSFGFKGKGPQEIASTSSSVVSRNGCSNTTFSSSSSSQSSSPCSSNFSFSANFPFDQQEVSSSSWREEERRESLLSISVGGKMETGGKSSRLRGRVVPCKNRLPPKLGLRESNELPLTTSEGEKEFGKKALVENGGRRVEEIRIVERVEEVRVKVEEMEGPGANKPILAKAGWQANKQGERWGLQIPVKGEEGITKSVVEESKESELDKFRRELKKYPEMTFYGYERMPVEEFGLAMLRGMGYEPEKDEGDSKEDGSGGGRRTWAKPYELKKRIYQRAGLGADESVMLPTEQLEKAKHV